MSTKSVFEFKMAAAKKALAKDVKALEIEQSKYELLKKRQAEGKLDKKDKERLMEYKSNPGIGCTYLNPINPVTAKDSWLGSRAMHSKSIKDNHYAQAAYARGGGN